MSFAAGLSMSSDLDYIETLDDISNAIKLARSKIDGEVDTPGSWSSLSTTKVSLSDLPKDVDGNIKYERDSKGGLGSTRSIRDLLVSWQLLVDNLFEKKCLLEYAPGFENCISQISDVEPGDRRKLCDLVDLLRQAVDHYHGSEDDMAAVVEIRYVTLLELVLSYNAEWRPSSNLNEIWEDLELHVESDCRAVDFRRVAYTVLVQLPWVPSSNGLFAACSYQDSDAIVLDLPEHLNSKFSQIYSGPLLRSDRVHQILAGLTDDEPFTITISFVPEDGASTDTNGDGMGKTTLAALLASHPTILENHKVFWIHLDEAFTGYITTSSSAITSSVGSLPYQVYMDCLKEICRQMGKNPNWPERILRWEDTPIRVQREKEHMMLAKQYMAKLLEGLQQGVLVVIDCVRDEQDYEWFHFTETQSSIVISKSNYIPGTTYSVEMEGLGEDESIILFARESSNDPDHPVLRTVEAKTACDLCLNHPLIIRTAAHWFKMKQVTAGFAKALEELNLELSVLRNTAKTYKDTFDVLTEVLNAILRPSVRQTNSPSKILKICLSSASVVFGMAEIPLDAVLALWSQILSNHPNASAELGGENKKLLSKHGWFIAETFIHLGFFSFSEKENVIFVQLHHPLYVRYGLDAVRELAAGEASVDDTKARWHGAFVSGYNVRLRSIKESRGNLKDSCRAYALQNVIRHMIESMSIPKVLDMLKDDRFCRERLTTFGWMKGAQLHVDDCKHLREAAKQSKSASESETQKVVLSCLKKVASILSEEPDITDETRLEKAMALHLVAFIQADNGGITEALNSFKNALQLLPSQSHPFAANIMLSQASLQLLRSDYDKALKKLKACTKLLKDTSNDEYSLSEALKSEIAQLRGDALASSCDYVSAEASYDEALQTREAASRLETGTALYRRARLYQTMGELDQAVGALLECINWKLDTGERTSRNLASAYSTAGDIYIEFEETDKAGRQYESALDTLVDLGIERGDVDYHLLQGKIHLLKDEISEGKSSFQIVRQIIKRAPKLLLDESAYNLRVMGKMCMNCGEMKFAKDILEEGIDLTMDRPESIERAYILYELGQCLFELEGAKDAVVCMEEALQIRKSKLGDCELVLESQIELGNLYKRSSMTKECLDTSKEVMHLTEKLHKGDETRAASAIFGVAEAYEVLGEYDQAVSKFEECNNLLRRSLHSDHPDVANVLQRIGKLHAEHKRYDSAFDRYRQALEIGRANFELEHPELGETLYQMGMICRNRADFTRARDYLQESLSIFKSNEMAQKTCLALMELGNVCRMTKDPDTAVTYYERCFTFVNEEDFDPAILGTLHLSYGHAHLSKGHLSEAQESFELALKNRTERLGKDDLWTAKASRSLGIAKYIHKSFPEARIYLEDFVRVMDAQRNIEDIHYILALHLLGEVSFEDNRYDEAKLYWMKAKHNIEEFPDVGDEIPELHEILTSRLEKAEKGVPKTTFFSRFTELARFEDEVSSEIPVEERLQDILQSFVFFDE